MPRHTPGHRMHKSKSRRQVAMLLGAGSPLTTAEKARLRAEIRGGKVKVRAR